MNKNLKVVQLIDSLYPGGAEMMAINIANALAQNGVSSHVCATRIEGSLKALIASEVGYIYLHKKSTFDIKAIFKLKKYIKKHEISIIHAHSSSYFISFLLKLFYPSVKIVWHNHYGNNVNLSFYKKIPLLLVSNFFFAIISVNRELQKWVNKNFTTKNSYVLYNFPVLYKNVKNKTVLKGKQNYRIVCLANFRKEKDHLNLLNAFKILNKDFKDWTIHFIGLNFNDEYYKTILQYIENNKLENYVFLYGSSSDIQYILKQATIGVLASKFEGLPVTLLEYGLAKLPVVVTNVGECSKVVTHQKNGLAVSPNNSIEFAKAIQILIENESLRIEFGEKLFENIQLNYSKENYIQQLISIYSFER